MAELPSGTVTFLFTDIEGSTGLWERDRTAMATAVDRHLAVLRTAIEARSGVLFKTVGDAVQAAFPAAPGAISAAIAAQRALQAEPWSDPPQLLHVRMALHAGEAIPRDGDYLAAPLNRLARLLAAGHGGQILVTEVVERLVAGALPEGVSLHPLGTHRLRDLQEPEDVFQVVASGLPDQFPPLQSLPRHPTNLNIPPTGLIGRDAEVAGILRLFDEGTRLVTLTGPGGTGKTRLALEIAAEALDRYPDGVFFVDLSPLTDSTLVIPTIAVTLGVRENPGEPMHVTLGRYLAERTVLLVLDNCEQVLEAGPDLAALLTTCAHLQILTTSREPLRLRAEQVFPVSPLPLPDTAGDPHLVEIARVASVALFVERAKAADPDFMLTDENAAAVSAICHRLDGLPLAIELAAARVRLLRPEALLARLDTRLPLLTSGARDAPARQRTLREAIAWSHDLLSQDEQRLYRHLSVFVGGWTLEAAEAVTDLDHDLDVLAGLAALTDKSLVRLNESAPEQRYGMLETIREYGTEQFTTADDATAIRDRHAGYFLALAERAASAMNGPDQRQWLIRLGGELANLRAALAWCEQTGHVDQMQRLVGSLYDLWTHRGDLGEGRQWVERALLQGGAATVRIPALWAGVVITFVQGDFAQSVAWTHEGLELMRESGDDRLEGRFLYNLVTTAWMQGDVLLARSRADHAIRRLRELDDRPWLAQALSDIGTAMSDAGETALAARLSEEGLALHRELGNKPGLAIKLMDMGALAHNAGETQTAARNYAESLTIWHEFGDSWWSASPLAGVAGLACAVGMCDRAARLLGAASYLREMSGAATPPYEQVRDEQTVLAARSALGDETYEREHGAGQQLSPDQAVAEALLVTTAVLANHAG